MKGHGMSEDIGKAFPDAEIARVFFARQNILLEQRYGFTPENTRFAEGGCCDEVNEPEYRFMEGYWGERFKFGGLAGYCHGGKSALRAVSHHAPEVDGTRNLLLVAGSHIGIHDGEWGKVLRNGQPKPTACCGSLAAVLQGGFEAVSEKPVDPLDLQQHTVEQILLPYLRTCAEEGRATDILEATRFLMQRIDEDLLAIVQDVEARFNGRIALITGITINTSRGNLFSPSRVEVRGVP
ncbi:MAG: hypothetical protein JW821_07520 [Deltaproteobacteria bacterium]|nr:hypothetical protein [Deltaproteobacteria bacterium]